MKTFIFDDFGHRHFHYFHFSISNKTPTISQHTRDILLSRQFKKLPITVNWESRANKIKIHLGSYFWHHKTSPLTWFCLRGVSSWLENPEKCCSLRPSFSTTVKDISAEICAASKGIYWEPQCLFCGVSDFPMLITDLTCASFYCITCMESSGKGSLESCLLSKFQK